MNTSKTTKRTVDATTTTAPVEPGVVGSPEFGRIPDVQRTFGLKRGYLYLLINEGKIKSVCLRKPGAKTGVRLIHLQSVRDYLNANLDGGARATECVLQRTFWRRSNNW
jgi:hypothetical protein